MLPHHSINCTRGSGHPPRRTTIAWETTLAVRLHAAGGAARHVAPCPLEGVANGLRHSKCLSGARAETPLSLRTGVRGRIG
eukprot:scaffold207_cov409-Prasinococcus_capsulatus_cf.AAC.5